MRSHFPLLLIPLLLTTALALPTDINTIPATNHLPSLPTNLTAFLPPRGFSISTSTTHSSSVPLPSHSIFALTIQALLSLVSLPFTSSIPRAKALRLPAFPGIVLTLSGPKGGFEIRYAIWGLTTAIKYMIDEQAFRDFDFDLRWLGGSVGRVRFIVDPRGTLEIGGNNAMSQDEHSSLIPTTNNLQQARDTVYEIAFRTIKGPPMPFQEIMMTIIGSLTDCAPFAPSQTLLSQRFISSWPGYSESFSLNELEMPTKAFNYGFVTLVLGQAAAWYLAEENESKGVSLLVKDGGKIVASGSLLPDPKGEVGRVDEA
ncbi:MAG: hypothetical protein Q9170_001139 [Blastenia crenularia]